MKKIGLFGGAFNPPHLGHLILAETICEAAGLDEIWWLPAPHPPHKDTVGMTDSAHRWQMVQCAIADNERFVASDVEFHREGKSYTVETLRHVQTQFPDDTFFLLIGGDSLRDFHKWYAFTEIIERVSLLVFPRPHVDLSAVSPDILAHTTFVDAPLIALSSTHIRTRLMDRKSVRYCVPESVLAYIDTHQLYR